LDLQAYARILRHHWVSVVSIALAGLLVSGVATVMIKPSFTAKTELFVAIQNSGSVQELQQGNTFSQGRVQSYVRTVETPVVLQPVIDSLGLPLTSDQLATRVEATVDLNTVLISISVVDASPAQAAAIAQAVAGSLIDAVERLEKPKTGGTSPVSMSIIRPAESPLSASSPNVRLNLLLGLIVGLILGIGLVVLRTTMDNRIRSEADLRDVTDVPLLGGMSYDPDAARKPLITQDRQQSPRAESFRQLRTNLQFSNISGNPQAVVVTSSLPGEGKSTTATNLAIAVAQGGGSVCLVDADLRRPMDAEYLGLEGEVGLTTVLIGAARLEDVLQPWGEDNLYVLTSGSIPPNPSELLGSSTMKDLIQQLQETFDTVIIDAPPLLPVTDAAVLSQHVDGVVLVVGCKSVRKQELEKSLAALALVGARTLGVVLNLLPAKGPDAYAYGYYSSASAPSSGRKAPRQTSPRGDVHGYGQSADGEFSNTTQEATTPNYMEEDLEALPRRLRSSRADHQ
jgi:capsular exopolysaccharide synthesis family protein